jgi:hypothetical protein
VSLAPRRANICGNDDAEGIVVDAINGAGQRKSELAQAEQRQRAVAQRPLVTRSAASAREQFLTASASIGAMVLAWRRPRALRQEVAALASLRLSDWAAVLARPGRSPVVLLASTP